MSLRFIADPIITITKGTNTTSDSTSPTHASAFCGAWRRA